MRILLLILATLSALLGLIMTILPFGTIGVLPGIVCLLLAVGAYFLSKKQQKSLKIPMLFAVIGILVIIGSGTKSLWVKDEVAIDQEFEEKEEAIKNEAIEELKELESDLEEIEE